MWQTNAIALRAGGEAMLIDSPVLPRRAGGCCRRCWPRRASSRTALLATHGDFDHLLGRLAFPDLSLGVAESTQLRLRAEPGRGPARAARPRRRALRGPRRRRCRSARCSRCRCPGGWSWASEELELHPTEGHTADGMAVFAPGLGLLVVGDYLSPVEIPMISPGGSVAGLPGHAGAPGAAGGARPDTVVPGHGPAGPRHRAADPRRGRGLPRRARARGGAAAAARGPRQQAQRRIHAENLRQIG